MSKSDTNNQVHTNIKMFDLTKKITYETIKSAQSKGLLSKYVDNIANERKAVDKEFVKLFEYARKLSAKEQLSIKKYIYSKILSGIKIEEISEALVNNAMKMNLPLKNVASFRTCLTLRSRKKQLSKFQYEWTIDEKNRGYSFIDTLNLKRPAIVKNNFRLSQMPKKEGITIKPSYESDSRGVYLVISFDKIIDVKKSVILTNWIDLEKNLKNDLSSGRVKKDDWKAEELVFEDKKKLQPGRDLKFYCFYGNVALIRERLTFPEVIHCWWTPRGQCVRTGIYEDKLFQGDGITNNQISIAALVSKEIPAPFLRIDFLKSSDGIVFNEFTPRTGKYEQFNNEFDQLLGDYFLEAEERLLQDLFNGKQFYYFNKFLQKSGLNKKSKNEKICNTICLEIIVYGNVQNVGYRQYIYKNARKLQLYGMVENIPNGTVRLIVYGHEEKVQKLLSMCLKGSEKSIVDHIKIYNKKQQLCNNNSNDFIIKKSSDKANTFNISNKNLQIYSFDHDFYIRFGDQ